MTGIIGGLWVAFTYLDNQKAQTKQQELAATRQQDEVIRQRQDQQFEARRPFLEKQLERYLETAAIVGKIVTLKEDDSEYAKALVRFWQLYWTELSVVEDSLVKEAMQKVGGQLKFIDAVKAGSFANEEARQRYLESQHKTLQVLAYSLAQAIRASVDASWRIDRDNAKT
jgi:hypothetical protein